MRTSKTVALAALFALSAEPFLDVLSSSTLCSNPGHPSCAQVAGVHPSGEVMLAPGVTIENVGGVVSKCVGAEAGQTGAASCVPCPKECQDAERAIAAAKSEKDRRNLAAEPSSGASGQTSGPANAGMDLFAAMRAGPSGAGNPSDLTPAPAAGGRSAALESLVSQVSRVQTSLSSGQASNRSLTAYAQTPPAANLPQQAPEAQPKPAPFNVDCKGTFQSICTGGERAGLKASKIAGQLSDN